MGGELAAYQLAYLSRTVKLIKKLGGLNYFGNAANLITSICRRKHDIVIHTSRNL